MEKMETKFSVLPECIEIFHVSTHSYLVSEHIPFITKAFLILLIFARIVPLFGEIIWELY